MRSATRGVGGLNLGTGSLVGVPAFTGGPPEVIGAVLIGRERSRGPEAREVTRIARYRARMAECIICAKHRGEGPLGGELVAVLDGFWVYHAPPGEDGRAPLGYLFIESDRHAAYLADLTEVEAGALGRLRVRLARALRDEIGVDFTFAMVVGTGVAHFHEHLLPRHPGTPREVPWYRSHETAPQAARAEVADLTRRIANLLRSEA